MSPRNESEISEPNTSRAASFEELGDELTELLERPAHGRAQGGDGDAGGERREERVGVGERRGGEHDEPTATALSGW